MSKAKKSFGQHFLTDQGVLHRINELVNSKLLIVEVGPGQGALTAYLPEGSILIEADRDLIAHLEEKFSKNTVIFSDAVKVDFDDVTSKRPWVLVSNLPYNAAAAILNKAMSASSPPDELVIMVQKEQADRMREKPGSMGLLSVVVQYDYKIKKAFDVSREAFVPKPNVESTVLHFTRIKSPNPVRRESVIQLAKIAFSSRRKQLHKNVNESGLASSEEIKHALGQLEIPETARAQELSIEQWEALYDALKKEA